MMIIFLQFILLIYSIILTIKVSLLCVTYIKVNNVLHCVPRVRTHTYHVADRLATYLYITRLRANVSGLVTTDFKTPSV